MGEGDDIVLVGTRHANSQYRFRSGNALATRRGRVVVTYRISTPRRSPRRSTSWPARSLDLCGLSSDVTPFTSRCWRTRTALAEMVAVSNWAPGSWNSKSRRTVF